MTRTRSISLLAGSGLVTLAVLVAGCGGGGATAASPKAKSGAAASVAVAQAGGLGGVLVDSQGRTLYLFTKDSGMTSACSGECATAWPPQLTHGQPTAASGANASLLSTTTRSDGTSQVTYNGHPLYLFIKDKKPGDANGEGVTAFGGSWFAVSSAGDKVSKKAAPKASTGSSAPPTPAASAPKPAPEAPAETAPKPQPRPAPPAPPKAAPEKAEPPQAPSNGIPQNGGGDGDADNNGGPSDGDGNV